MVRAKLGVSVTDIGETVMSFPSHRQIMCCPDFNDVPVWLRGFAVHRAERNTIQRAGNVVFHVALSAASLLFSLRFLAEVGMHYGGDMLRTPTAYLAWAARCKVTKPTAVPASGLTFDLGESVVIDRRFIVVACNHIVGDLDMAWQI